MSCLRRFSTISQTCNLSPLVSRSQARIHLITKTSIYGGLSRPPTTLLNRSVQNFGIDGEVYRHQIINIRHLSLTDHGISRSHSTGIKSEVGEDATQKLFATQSKLVEAQKLLGRANESLSTTNEQLARAHMRLESTNARLQNLSRFESGSIWMKLRLLTLGFVFTLVCLEFLFGTGLLILSANRDYQDHRRIERLEEKAGLIDCEPSMEERID